MTGCNSVSARFYVALAAISLNFLAACEDQGNEGDDNLLTGGSLVLLIVIVVGFVLWRPSKKG